MVTSANVSCTLRWAEPADNGGRNDTIYNIRYREGGSSSNPITTSNVNYVITNLKPVTVYEISVTAENGVSHNEVSLDDLHQRTATITCTTTEGGMYLNSIVRIYIHKIFRMI